MTRAGPSRLAARAPLGFAVRFLVLFALLVGSLEAVRGTAIERWLVDDAVLRPTAAAIQLVDRGGGAIRVDRRSLVSAGSRLNVVRGCEGIETLLLLAAAVLAFPATAAWRLKGLALGAAVAWLGSVGRLVVLHLSLRYRPEWWDVLHGFVAPLGPIAIVAATFLWWSARAAPPAMPRAP